MSIYAIVPVKAFSGSKSRLASVLSPRQRAGLSRAFMGHALQLLKQIPEIARTLVVSRDPSALALARVQGAYTVTELGAPDLNAALARATQAAQEMAATAVLVLPTDLPFLTDQDVRYLLNDDGLDPLVALAPDRHEDGTNALFLRPPGVIEYAFGPHSFQQHLSRAAAAGARIRVCRLPGIALDVDVPGDWELYRQYALEK